MYFTYPISITNEVNGNICRDWRFISTPVDILLSTGETVTNVRKIDKIDDGFILNDKIIIPNISFSFWDLSTNRSIMVSLRDSNDIRLTNYIRYDHNQGWIKHCPKCNFDLPLSHFDYNGRYDGAERDQSDCMDCRGMYK